MWQTGSARRKLRQARGGRKHARGCQLGDLVCGVGGTEIGLARNPLTITFTASPALATVPNATVAAGSDLTDVQVLTNQNRVQRTAIHVIEVVDGRVPRPDGPLAQLAARNGGTHRTVAASLLTASPGPLR